MEKLPEKHYCKVCPKSYKKVTELLEHLKRHMEIKCKKPTENIQTTLLEETEVKLENEVICSYIMGTDDKNEKTNSPLRNKKHNEKSHQCKTCKKKFKLKIKHEYLRSRAYICLSLSSPFSSPSPVTVSQI